MIFSINFLNKPLYILLATVLLLAGCAGVEPGPPPLTIVSLETARQGSPVARRGALLWTVSTSGGQGTVAYEVWAQRAGIDWLLFSDAPASGSWTPKEPGSYRIKVLASDEVGTIADSGWSNEYSYSPLFNSESLYALLPVQNLSDTNAPLQDIHTVLRTRLTSRGFKLLDPVLLKDFMAKYRMRHTGGVSRHLSQKMQEELGVDGIFITSLETWQEAIPHRVSLITRVISTGSQPEVIWIDSVGLTSVDNPGLLGLGIIKNHRVLLSNALERLLDSFQSYLAGRSPEYLHTAEQQQPLLINADSETASGVITANKPRHEPQFFYRASTFDPIKQYTVAVLPFLNINTRKQAGDIVALHVVKQLHRYANLRVFEPGLVRQTLLRYRMIMQSGPSLAASDILTSERILDADLIVSGKVFDYQGAIGESKADFSIQIFDGVKREIIWASRSYVTGNQGVYFFDWGRVNSAHDLLSKMTEETIRLLEE
jgi:TolB-like protein